MKILGLIGHPVSHSRSPAIFESFFAADHLKDWQYRLFDLPHISQIEELLRDNPEIIGLNVTIPHKSAVLPFLDELSAEAEAVGAVNTIQVRRSPDSMYLKGHNTDIAGFSMALQNAFEAPFKNALILGNGGSSKAVRYALESMGTSTATVSRDGKHDYTYSSLDTDELNRFDLLVNTTPLGMAPQTNTAPELPYSGIRKGMACFDLIYEPEITLFMKQCAARGAMVAGGLGMLRFQAARSWEIFRQES